MKFRRHSDIIPKAERKMVKVKIIKTYFVENTNVKLGEDDSKILLFGK